MTVTLYPESPQHLALLLLHQSLNHMLWVRKQISCSPSTDSSLICILLFSPSQRLTRQEHRLVDGHRQTTMSPSDHYSAEDDLTERVPCATERVRSPWHTGTDPDSPVSRHDFEDDVEGGKDDWVAFELPGLGDCDEKYSKRNPPQIMAELTTELLAEEVLSIP